LQIAVDNAANLNRVVEFFEGDRLRARADGRPDSDVDAPDQVAAGLARREIQIYLRVLDRVHPGVGARLFG
jgi:hypothetical protein